MKKQLDQSKKRLPRLRAVMKWSGVTLCVLLFALWLASGWYLLHIRFGKQPSAGSTVVMSISAGQWHVRQVEAGLSVVLGPLDASNRVFPTAGQGTDFYIGPEPTGLMDSWDWPKFTREPDAIGPGYHTSADIPLYLPFLLVALPTGFLFYRDRKARPGHCAVCRYDLRGLPETTMRCPECGACLAESKENTA